jgi:acetolactate synthase-1/2/3 large subunit
MPRVEAVAAVIDILKQEGVRTIYGVPGGPIMPLLDAIHADDAIDFVLTKHEQAAAFAALGDAMVSGRLGVCLSTLGPGATNLLAGLPVAAVERLPVLAITGQVQTDGQRRGGHQDSSGLYGTPDQTALFAAVCKTTETVHHGQTVPDAIRRAIRHAFAGPRPGPTHVSFPSGVLHEKISYEPLRPAQYRLTRTACVDHDAVARIAKAMAEADAPTLLLGVRALRAGAGKAAMAIAEQFGAALVCDVGAKSCVDEAHDAFLGCLGVLGHRGAENFVKSRSDLIVAVGQSFDEVSMLSWDPALTKGRQLIQIDADPEEIGKAYPVDDAAVGDIGRTLQALCGAHPRIGAARTEARKAALAKIKAATPPFSSPEMQSDAVPPLPQRIVADLARSLPSDAFVLSDSSKWTRWLGSFFMAAQGQVLSAHDFEPMGWAVAAALGAQKAAPERLIVSLSGDGAFMMSCMEVATAVDQGLPIIWIVFNDGRLGIIHDLQETLYGGRYCGTNFTTPDLVAFAKSMGASGARVEAPGALGPVLAEARRARTPFVIDVRFDTSETPALRPRALLITKNMGLPLPGPNEATTRLLFKMLTNK